MSDHYADHQPQPIGGPYSWGTTAEGPGRWCILEHPVGVEAGLLFVTDADDAIGFLPNGAEAGNLLAPSVVEGVQAAYATGVSSPSMVFDAWAARSGMSVNARETHHAPDLGPVADAFTGG